MKPIFYSAKLSGFGDTAYPFEPLVSNCKHVKTPEEIDNPYGILCLWGGEDISPSIYGEEPNKFVGKSLSSPSYRDNAEIALFNRAVSMQMPILGICRGAQLGCALSGGKLVQHVNNHGRNHEITTNKGETYITSSLHHQQMFPWGTEFELIAWANSIGTTHIGEQDKEINFPEEAWDSDGYLREPEVCYFPKTKTLAIQGHPEFMRNAPFIDYCNKLIGEKFEILA